MDPAARDREPKQRHRQETHKRTRKQTNGQTKKQEVHVRLPRRRQPSPPSPHSRYTAPNRDCSYKATRTDKQTDQTAQKRTKHNKTKQTWQPITLDNHVIHKYNNVSGRLLHITMYHACKYKFMLYARQQRFI